MTARPNDIAAKADRLLAVLRSYADGVAVAFSGGIDSTVVAKAAHLALGEQAVAVTADSPSVARGELEDARRLADLIGIRHEIVRTEEFDDPDYLRNDGNRCYYCKSELYDQIDRPGCPDLGVAVVCSGANLDDLGDYRPGLTAAAERHVRHPLQEAGLHQGGRAGPGAATGACRPGTSRPRRACRAGWRPAWRLPRSGPPASRRLRYT